MKQVCTFKIKDEISLVLSGVQPNHIEMLVEEFSEYVPGYKHMPLYKMGAWDGKTTFVTKGGRTYQAFAADVVEKLKPLGYAFRMDDQRAPLVIDVKPVTKDQFADKGWIHRPHQVNAINSIIESGHRGVIKAATGAGKTAICAGLSSAYEACGFRSVVIVPNRDLIKQTMEQYVALGLDTGQYSGKVKDTDHQHVISTWQALKNHPELMLTFQVVIIDECQGAKSPVVSSLMIKHGAHIPVRIGCTGTIPKDRADFQTIYAAVGAKEVFEISAQELQEVGLLATLQISQLQLLDNETAQQFMEYSQEKTYLSLEPLRTEWIAKFLQRLAATNGNTLMLVSSIKQGKKIQSIIGDSSIFLHGQDDDATRQEAYAKFATNDNLIVIANVQIAAVGLSINRIFNLVLVDVGKAFTRVIQSIGRGLRLAEDKTHVAVYDIFTNYGFGHQHGKKRREYYREAKYPCTQDQVQYK